MSLELKYPKGTKYNWIPEQVYNKSLGWYVCTNKDTPDLPGHYLHTDGVIREGAVLTGWFPTKEAALAAIDSYCSPQPIPFKVAEMECKSRGENFYIHLNPHSGIYLLNDGITVFDSMKDGRLPTGDGKPGYYFVTRKQAKEALEKYNNSFKKASPSLTLPRSEVELLRKQVATLLKQVDTILEKM